MGYKKVNYLNSIKLLAIGNSFSDDSVEYLFQLLKDSGVKEIILGNLFIGGCSLQTHANNAKNQSKFYEYRKNATGKWITTLNTDLLTAILDEEWDIFTLQQASHFSGVTSTYNEDLDFLITYVNNNKLNKSAKLVWNMTWAYQSDSNHGAFPTYRNNQIFMYEAIVDAVKTKITTNKDIELVIPTGTAIQNVRTSVIKDTLTRDGFHLSLDLGRYIASLTWLKALTDFDISRISYVPDKNVVNSEVLSIVKECVNNAISNPFKISYSQYNK